MQCISVVEKLSEELSPTPWRVLGPDSVNLCQSQVFPILPTNFWVYQLTFPKQRRWSFGTKMPEIGVSWMSSHVTPPFTNTVCKYSTVISMNVLPCFVPDAALICNASKKSKCAMDFLAQVPTSKDTEGTCQLCPSQGGQQGHHGVVETHKY